MQIQSNKVYEIPELSSDVNNKLAIIGLRFVLSKVTANEFRDTRIKTQRELNSKEVHENKLQLIKELAEGNTGSIEQYYRQQRRR
jgi:hypothetical protein